MYSWLIPYGPVGWSQNEDSFTRAMVTEALSNDFYAVQYEQHPVFDLAISLSCPSVPSEHLNPRSTWTGKEAYDLNTIILANAFVSNFKQFD